MPSRQAPTQPPDRLTAVLGEVEHARRSGWTPEEPTGSAGRPRPPRSRRGRRPADVAGPRHLRDAPDERVRPHTPLVRPPRTLRDAVVAPGRVAVVAVLVLILTAAAVLGGRIMWLRMTAEPQQSSLPLPSGANSTSVQGTPPPTSSADVDVGAGRPTPAAAPTQLVVHVVGQVARPGVVTLRPGARVRDAVAAVGGARPGADLGRVNLARPVTDGEQVVIPRPGEEVSAAPGPPAAPSGAAPSAAATGPGAPAAGPVNLNQADEGTLDTLPGIGPVLAQRIVQWRTTHGRFSSVDELAEVSGIGDKLVEQLRPLVTV